LASPAWWPPGRSSSLPSLPRRSARADGAGELSLSPILGYGAPNRAGSAGKGLSDSRPRFRAPRRPPARSSAPRSASGTPPATVHAPSLGGARVPESPRVPLWEPRTPGAGSYGPFPGRRYLSQVPPDLVQPPRRPPSTSSGPLPGSALPRADLSGPLVGGWNDRGAATGPFQPARLPAAVSAAAMTAPQDLLQDLQEP
jgi:hypothetical protein